MSTDKDTPKHRGIPARQNDAAVKEAFSKQIDRDNHGDSTGLPKKQALENHKRLMTLMHSVKAKRP